MIVLVVDPTIEGQTKIARMLESIDPSDRDALDLQVNLSVPQSCLSRLQQSDILIIGPSMGEDALNLARQAKKIARNIEIIVMASLPHYSGQFFKHATAARVRKILPENASSLDLLQEIVGISDQFRLSGRTKRGKLIVVTQAKGGIGSTTLVAALAELSHKTQIRTLVWDLDIETRDLSRGLRARGTQGQMVSAWVNGSRDITLESLREALVPISSCISLLPPPHDIAAGADFVGHPDSIPLINRIIELVKTSHEAIIVDTAGRMGPTTGTLLSMADEIILMVDDSLLGLSAAHAYLDSIVPLLKSNQHSIRIVGSGMKHNPRQMLTSLSEQVQLDDDAWRMPIVPCDTAAEMWPGSGNTLYSLGHRSTKRAIEEMGTILGIGTEPASKVVRFAEETSSLTESTGWFRSMLSRASNS